MMNSLLRLLKEEDGITVQEYALITGIIAFTAFTAAIALYLKFLILFAS